MTTVSSIPNADSVLKKWNHVEMQEWENYQGVVEKYETHPHRQAIKNTIENLVQGDLEETLDVDSLASLLIYKAIFSWEESYSMEVSYDVYCSSHFTHTIDLDEDEFKAHIMDEELEVEEPDLADACYQGEIEVMSDGESGSRFYNVHLNNFQIRCDFVSHCSFR